MVKRISFSQIELGTHPKEFCGSWMKHPFWHSAFVITDPRTTERILERDIEAIGSDSAMRGSASI